MKMFLDMLLNHPVPQLDKEEDDLPMTLEQENMPPHFHFCLSTYPFC